MASFSPDTPVDVKRPLPVTSKAQDVSEEQKWDINLFPTPLHYKDKLEHILIPNGVIKNRVEKLVEEITNDYLGQEIHLLCVLNGASVFFGDMLSTWMKIQSRIYLPITYDFVRVKSYSGDKSTGNVQITGIDKIEKLAGRHVILVEDIVDTGLTMSKLIPYLHEQAHPASVRVVTLLEKRVPSAFKADYVGFTIPPVFIVGYGLDYDEKYRDMEHIAVMKSSAANLEEHH